jgi:hypothetical protein
VKDWAENHKPSAGVATQLLLAGLMWTVVGAALSGVGGLWLWQSTPAAALWVAPAAIAIGLLKSRMALDRAARKITVRIRERGDGRCLGGFLSPSSWALVILMMVGGRFLRTTVTHVIVGPLYLMVGTALLVSSRIAWQAWSASLKTIGDH